MARYAELHDGTRLEFPDDTTDDVIRSTVKRRLSGGEPAVKMPDEKSRVQEGYNAIAIGNSFLQNIRDGMATSMQRYRLGGRQMVGAATPQDKSELEMAEKAFGSTVGGKIGDFVGTALPAVAATFLPGGNTIAGQALIGTGMGALMPADSAVGRVLNAGLGAGLGAAAKFGGDKVANWLTGRSAASAATAQQANAVRDATTAEARSAGYTLPPTSANPSLVNRLAEGMAGKISTAQSAAIKNQPVTDSLVRKALGLADDVPLERETLVGLRATAGKAYEPVRQMGAVQADDAYRSAVQAVKSRFEGAAKDFPELANKEVLKLVRALDKAEFDASSAVDAVQVLRAGADDNLGPLASGAQKAVGRAQRSLADALEAVLERHAEAAGSPEIVRGLREARTLIAKTYTVEKSLREGAGSVSAAKLAKQLEKGVPLSGELKTVAKVGQVYPRAVQDVTSSMPGVSPLDFGAAGMLSGVTGNPAMLTMIGARPAARAMILSPAYQRLMAGAPSYGPGLLGGAVPPLLRNPAARLMLTGGVLDAATQ